MFVSYLVPREDISNLPEDGLFFVAVGATREAAEAAVRSKYEKIEAEDNERAATFGLAEEEHTLEDDYVLHTQEA